MKEEKKESKIKNIHVGNAVISLTSTGFAFVDKTKKKHATIYFKDGKLQAHLTKDKNVKKRYDKFQTLELKDLQNLEQILPEVLKSSFVEFNTTNPRYKNHVVSTHPELTTGFLMEHLGNKRTVKITEDLAEKTIQFVKVSDIDKQKDFQWGSVYPESRKSCSGILFKSNGKFYYISSKKLHEIMNTTNPWKSSVL